MVKIMVIVLDLTLEWSKHLKEKSEKIKDKIKLKSGDIVIDIAGNDGTFLGFFRRICNY